MSRLALYFLGTPRLELDGETVSLSYSKAVALLAYLSLARQPYTRQTLAALLWPDYDPASARSELRRMLWVLNKRLGPNWLELDHQTVSLPRQHDLWVDVDHFRELLALSSQHDHLANEVCPTCVEPLKEAVALVHGDFLAGFSLPDSPDFDTWQTFETESLRSELAGALERLVQLLSQQQEVLGEQAIAYARRWLALDPLHEPAHRQLMQLYAWSGQSTAALRQYQTCVQVLKEELGVSPSEETTVLYETIKANRLPPPPATDFENRAIVVKHLSQDPNTVQPMARSGLNKTVEPVIQPEHNLPAQLTPFIGRQQEVAAACQLLTQDTPQVRLLTMTGTGGTGKTRLSLQVAAELQDYFADGVFFVSLACLNDPQLFMSTIARQLDVREGGSQPVLQILQSALQEKHLLLVLDNFEQIISAAPFITDLLAAVSRLKILVTSRALLRLRGEYVFLVPPLKLPDQADSCSLEELGQSEAIQLFVERAQVTATSFTLTAENGPVVAEICRRLDGLPLAIELAAARIKLLPPQALLARLSQRLKVLTGGSQDMPPRQQTLRNTIDWSYSLLDPAEQTLFSCLAVFVGGFTLESAEAICNSDSFPLDTVGQPLDILEGITSLLNKSLLVQQSDNGSQPRFTMLETIREYALERLAESEQLEALQQRHAYYFAAEIDQIGINLHFFEDQWLDWAEEEYNNLQAALTWSQSTPVEVELGLRMLGVLYWFWYRRGYLTEGRAWCQGFGALTSEKDQTVGRASFLWASGSLALMQGDLVEAGQRLKEGLAISRELGEARWLGPTLIAWGVLALYQGDTAAAQGIFEETLALGERSNLWWVIADSLLNLGHIAIARRDYITGRNWLEQAAALAENNGDIWLGANVYNNLGDAARIQGDYEQAQQSYEESQVLFRKIDAKPDIARSLHSLGYVALHQGDYEQAEIHLRESLNMFQELGNKRGMAECLAGLAGLLATKAQPDATRAAQLLAAAETQLQASKSSWWPADQVEVDRNLAVIKAILDEGSFTSSWIEGQTMSLIQAVAAAMEN